MRRCVARVCIALHMCQSYFLKTIGRILWFKGLHADFFSLFWLLSVYTTALHSHQNFNRINLNRIDKGVYIRLFSPTEPSIRLQVDDLVACKRGYCLLVGTTLFLLFYHRSINLLSLYTIAFALRFLKKWKHKL